MSSSSIAFLALGIIGGLGIIFIVIAVLIKISSNNKISKCTENTEGRIIKHKFPGGSRVVPVIEYVVNDRAYYTVKKYNGYKRVRVTLPIKSDYWEDDKGYVCVKAGFIINVRKLANKMWPIGSPVKVFYSPNNPKNNYVDRPLQNGLLTKIFFATGIMLIVLGCVMFMLIK